MYFSLEVMGPACVQSVHEWLARFRCIVSIQERYGVICAFPKQNIASAVKLVYTVVSVPTCWGRDLHVHTWHKTFTGNLILCYAATGKMADVRHSCTYWWMDGQIYLGTCKYWYAPSLDSYPFSWVHVTESAEKSCFKFLLSAVYTSPRSYSIHI